jgi:hypothetical protein
MLRCTSTIDKFDRSSGIDVALSCSVFLSFGMYFIFVCASTPLPSFGAVPKGQRQRLLFPLETKKGKPAGSFELTRYVCE